MVTAGVESVCEISSHPLLSLNTGVGDTNGSKGGPKPVTTVTVPPPIRLAGGHAPEPAAIASASLAPQAGIFAVWKVVPAGASSWKVRIGEGFAFASPPVFV